MYWPRWYFMNKRRFLPLVLILLVVLLAIWLTVSFIHRFSISEEELFHQSLSNTLACQSYRYSVEVKQNGRDTITLVEGERSEPNRVHLKGSMQKSQMEFIHIEDITYMKDPWSDRWFTLRGNSMVQSELFATEFNPLGLLKFKNIPKFKNLGNEDLDGVDTVVLEISPSISNPLLELKYNEFKFKLWIDEKEKLIRKAEMMAASPNAPEGLLVIMNFKDFNQPITIHPPQGNVVENY